MEEETEEAAVIVAGIALGDELADLPEEADWPDYSGEVKLPDVLDQCTDDEEEMDIKLN